MRDYTCTMELEKNDSLVLNICKVLIRSTDDVVDIPSLQKIYHTPSMISFTKSTTETADGTLINKNLRLSYPGLSESDFSKFNKLTKGVYQVYIELEDGKVFEVASSQLPMSCSTSFDISRGHELVLSSTSPEELIYLGSNVPGEEPIAEQKVFNYDFDFNL